MSTPSSVDAIRAEAQRLADAESWPAVVALLAPYSGGALQDGELLLLYAEARWRSGEQREVLEFLPDVVRSLAGGEHRPAHRRALNLLGAAYFAVGALDDAASAWSEALELASRDDDQLLLARASNNLGAVANVKGRHEEALSHYRLALPAYQRVGQARGIAEGYHNLAITCRDMGELEEADEHERRAIDYATTAGAVRVAAMGRVGRAEIALRHGDAELAEMTASRAADEFSRHGDPLNESDARRLVAVARVGQGRVADALAAFGEALSIAESRGYRFHQAEVLRDRVDAWVLAGDRALAIADARRSIELFESLGATAEVRRLDARLAELA